ncbi:S-adenosyl-L-methionine-dependent methyltransferase [Boeremia exigua]|uniref:S-adenosyl-L-methionine-dependent methyltransferase n=1 Tax=Boeremia exigua TaxID=749465 RepID=UPI001E8E6DDF|nr:S-adenosyl-L-methionine-dependent methyltransferase [Boeremia exigua]KAH6642228.1 S-adenosyl-L-methionine-dependent methyltransferase [Boeremia exigua]
MGSIEHKSPETLLSVAAKITEYAQQLTKELEAGGVAPVTLDADSPIKYSALPGNAFVVRQHLEDALKDMYILSQGPSESTFNYCHTAVPDIATLNVLNQFDFWGAVPLKGTATDEQVAAHTALPLEVATRTLDHAVTMRYFTRPTPSTVAHTSRSAALAQDTGLQALVQMVVDETSPPMLMLPEALRRFAVGKKELGLSQKDTAFRLCHSGGAWGEYDNTWEFLENDGEGERKGWRQRNFIKFMAYIKDLFKTEALVLEALDWAAAGEATVVDIGGSAGHDDIALATAFPNLTITVQDLPQVAPVFASTCPPALRPRISFMTHNMFDPQPVSADIYMLKWILHDWADAESLAILRALIPALKPGARVLFIDYVGTSDKSEDVSGVPLSMRAFGSATDMRMLALFNAKERPAGAWKDVFKRADERFEVVGVKADPLTFMCVLEAVWRG